MASLQQQRNETKRKILQKMDARDGYHSATAARGPYYEEMLARKTENFERAQNQ